MANVNIAVTGTITHNNSFQQNHFFKNKEKENLSLHHNMALVITYFAYEYTANASANLRQYKKFMYLF